jgi:hypothetical protein
MNVALRTGLGFALSYVGTFYDMTPFLDISLRQWTKGDD